MREGEWQILSSFELKFNKKRSIIGTGISGVGPTLYAVVFLSRSSSIDGSTGQAFLNSNFDE